MTEMVPAWINGKLQPVEKIEVHKRALRHKAVSVFIMVGTETLLQKRALNKYHCPGLWANACCTHPYWDEASETCARRRIKEELGISTTLPLLYRNQVLFSEIHRIRGMKSHISRSPSRWGEVNDKSRF